MNYSRCCKVNLFCTCPLGYKCHSKVPIQILNIRWMCWGFGWLAILDKCPNWAGILPTFLHIFLAIISAMELMLRPYISCHSPGGTGDSRAFYGTALSDFLQDIPCGFYIVADSAYTLSSSLLVSYTGSDKGRKENDVFNFYLSQLRIKRQA